MSDEARIDIGLTHEAFAKEHVVGGIVCESQMAEALAALNWVMAEREREKFGLARRECPDEWRLSEYATSIRKTAEHHARYELAKYTGQDLEPHFEYDDGRLLPSGQPRLRATVRIRKARGG